MSRGRRGWWLMAFLGIASLGPSCSEPPTRVLLVVDAQPRIRAMVRSLRVTAFGLQRIEATDLRPTQTEQQSWPPEGKPIAFPASFLLSQERFPRYEVRVEALDDRGARLAVQGVRGSFVTGRTRLVRLVLVDGCLAVPCTDRDGVCGCPDGSLPALNCDRDLACVQPREVGDGDDYDPGEVYACDSGSADACRPAPLQPEAGVDGGQPEGGVDGGPEGGVDGGMDASMPDAAPDARPEGGTDASMPPAPTCGMAPMDGVPCLPGPSGCSGDVSRGVDALPSCPDTDTTDCQTPICSAAPDTVVPRPANSACGTTGRSYCAAASGCTATYSLIGMGTWPATMCSSCSIPPPHGPRFGAAVAIALGGSVLAASEPDAPTFGGMNFMGRVLLVSPSGPDFTSLTWEDAQVRQLGPADAPMTVMPTVGRAPDTDRDMAFGAALAMTRHDGEVWLAVGAPLAAPMSGDPTGAVFLYRWSETAGYSLPPANPRPVAVLWPSEPRPNQAFGSAVALRSVRDGTLRLLVGAPETSAGTTTGPGAAFLYTWDATAGNWRLSLRWLGVEGGERFGEAVALDQERAYAAGYVPSGEAAVGVAATDGSGGWRLETLLDADVGTGLCLAPSPSDAWRQPRLRLDADLGVVALLLATDENRLDDDPMVEEKGRLGIFERTGDAGSWLGPVVFHTANVSSWFRGLQAEAFDDVAVAGGLVLVAGWLTDVDPGRPGAVALVRQNDSSSGRWEIADAGIGYGIEEAVTGIPGGLRARAVALDRDPDASFPAIFGLFGDTSSPPDGSMENGRLVAIRQIGGS